jgi:PTH1 family peptidyl-tRNA hydrolase
MDLIVGLGNIGQQYQNTRHNVGFLVIDEIAKNLHNISNINKTDFNAIVWKNANAIYAKPTTYMNNSGIAVGNISRYYKIELPNIIVIHDDLDLPFGAVRFKQGGGSGGHNGLKSIDSHITKDYIRVRVGIGKAPNKDGVVDWVLSNFSKDQLQKLYLEIIPHIIKSIEALQNNDLNYVKSLYTIK